MCVCVCVCARARALVCTWHVSVYYLTNCESHVQFLASEPGIPKPYNRALSMIITLIYIYKMCVFARDSVCVCVWILGWGEGAMFDDIYII